MKQLVRSFIFLLTTSVLYTECAIYQRNPSNYCSFLQSGNAVGGDIIELVPGVYDRLVNFYNLVLYKFYLFLTYIF